MFIGQSPDHKIIPAHGLAVVDAKTGRFSLELPSANNPDLGRGEYKVIIQGANYLVPPMYASVDTTPLMVSIPDSPFEIKIRKPGR